MQGEWKEVGLPLDSKGVEKSGISNSCKNRTGPVGKITNNPFFYFIIIIFLNVFYLKIY